MNHFMGIDYGARNAGTTAICFFHNNYLHIKQSLKKTDADQLIEQVIHEINPRQIFIDAPLSLPAAYFGKGEDFFFRKSDQEVNAMSPMFLGGLTARAIKLKNKFKQIEFFEAYPALNVKLNFTELIRFYKNKSTIEHFLDFFKSRLPYPFKHNPINWHQIDSALAWYSGFRYQNNQAKFFGDKSEGLIWV